MALFAICLPILPGKKDQWLGMMEKLKGPARAQLNATREAAGVHERTFLQTTPAGDLVIVTLEGDDPLGAFGKMMADPALKDFKAWAEDVHGVKLDGPMPPMPELVYDSKG
jgi:hypothetical protein